MVSGMTESSETDIQPRCRNCDAPLVGEYCSQCGQREGRGDIRFSEAMADLAGDFIAWDSRIWRTLIPLLFRPGFLTAEFMAGRRAHYVAPLRLYLIISFILFLVLTFTTAFSTGGPIVTVDSGAQQLFDPNDLGVLDELDMDIDIEELAQGNSMDGETVNIDLADEDSPVWLQKLDERMEGNAANLEDSGDFVQELVEYLPQMMFLLLPIFAVLLKICYLGSPYHYLQHLVFSLNYHSFAFLLYLIALLLERVGAHFDGMVLLVLLLYLPIGLWRAYGSGIGGAIGKSLLIYFSYGILLILAFAAASILALALM